MRSESQLVTFLLDGQYYALYLSAIERVIPSIEITTLPGAPDIILGIINVHGRIIPVVNIRKRFGLPGRNLFHTDHFIIADAAGRSVAIITDKVSDTIEYSLDSVIPGDAITPDLEYIDGVVKLKDGLVLIHNLKRFLALPERQALDQVLPQSGDIHATPAA